jgi:hypothetical protein
MSGASTRMPDDIHHPRDHDGGSGSASTICPTSKVLTVVFLSSFRWSFARGYQRDRLGYGLTPINDEIHSSRKMHIKNSVITNLVSTICCEWA